MLAVCKRLVQELSDTSAIEEQIEAAATEMNGIADQWDNDITDQAIQLRGKEDALEKAELETQIAQFKKAEEKRKRLQKLLDEQISRVDTMNIFLRKIESTEEITTFDDDLWRVSVESVTVYGDGNMLFRFMDGREITA